MRERWFGATGRKVPEIALDGTLELDDALVLDDLSDVERIREAHLAGTPIVVRAGSKKEIIAALSLGEVASVLVRDEALLDVDLAELTYG